MESEDMTQGAFVFWPWGDQEIDNPKILRRQLLDIHAHGFVGALATLKSSRYEFIDRKVLRAVSQASQWAKKRHLSFWFQTDPRQASRVGQCLGFDLTRGESQRSIVGLRGIVDRRPERVGGMPRHVDRRYQEGEEETGTQRPEEARGTQPLVEHPDPRPPEGEQEDPEPGRDVEPRPQPIAAEQVVDDVRDQNQSSAQRSQDAADEQGCATGTSIAPGFKHRRRPLRIS